MIYYDMTCICFCLGDDIVWHDASVKSNVEAASNKTKHKQQHNNTRNNKTTTTQ